MVGRPREADTLYKPYKCVITAAPSVRVGDHPYDIGLPTVVMKGELSDCFLLVDIGASLAELAQNSFASSSVCNAHLINGGVGRGRIFDMHINRRWRRVTKARSA